MKLDEEGKYFILSFGTKKEQQSIINHILVNKETLN